MGTLIRHGGEMFFLSGEEFSSCGAQISFCSTYTSVYPPNIFQHYFLWALVVLSPVLLLVDFLLIF